MKRTYLSVLILTIGLVALSDRAHAAGYEVMPAGARAAGRGGANVVGEDSPLALRYNPAQLAGVRGFRLTGAANLHFASTCFRREIVGTPDGMPTPPGDPDTMTRTPVPEICSRQLGAIPQLAGAVELSPGLVLGAGLLAPSAVRGAKFGTGEVELADGTPNPVRYSLLEQHLLQIFPAIGLGWEPVEGLRVGATFGWGITFIDNRSAAYAGFFGDNEVRAEGQDFFVPRATVGVHYSLPDDLGIELAGAFTWIDDVKTGKATLSLSSPTILGLNMGQPAVLDHVYLTAPQTWDLSLGVRYAMPLDRDVATDDVGDRLSTERFDVEVDFVLVGSSRVDAITLDLTDSAMILGLLPAPDDIRLERRFKNQFVLRVGGDLTIVPGLLAARLGYSYESNGVSRGYESLDFWNLRRYGVHLGATVRIAKYVDLSIAYVHVFQQTITNDASTARLVRNVSDPATQAQVLINAGTFRSNYDGIIAEASLNF